MTGALNKSVVCPQLIGRTDEIAVFRKLIDEAKSGKGPVPPVLTWVKLMVRVHNGDLQP